MDFNQEPKTKEDVKNMLKHVEDEYRKANITENTYKELKEKYKQQLSYMDNTVSSEEAQSAAPEAAPAAAAPEEEKKKGFGGLFHKKKQEDAQPLTASAPAPSVQNDDETRSAAPASDGKALAEVQKLSIEMEKLKVMIDSVKEQKKSTDESIQSIFEGIGEVRSMSIQNDASLREVTSKLERAEDDMNNLRPKELEKRFTQINEVLEKYQLVLEKLQAKTDDMTERLNKVYESVRVIGNTENLANLNQNVQKKLNDIREATNYVERLASKAEKIFVDLKMELEDLVLFKSKQEAMEESIRDILKSMDALGVKFEGYTTKKEMEEEKQDIMILSKQQEDIKNAMAIIQTSVPEPILQLRKEREDIKLFIDSLDEQVKTGKLKAVDFETVKKKNIEKLKLIDGQLLAEWKKFEKMSKEAPPPVPASAEPTVNVVEAPKEESEAPAQEEPHMEESKTSDDQEAKTPQAEPESEKKEFAAKVDEKIKKGEEFLDEPKSNEDDDKKKKIEVTQS